MSPHPSKSKHIQQPFKIKSFEKTSNKFNIQENNSPEIEIKSFTHNEI